MGRMTALSICNHIRIGTVEHLLEKMLKTLHPRAPCMAILLGLCHEPVRQELIPENGRALWGSIPETDKEWFVFRLDQSSAREQQEWGCSVSGDKPGAEGDSSPGGVLTNGTQSCRICTQWAGKGAGNRLYQQPQTKQSNQSGLGIHLGLRGDRARGRSGNNVTYCICPRSALRRNRRPLCPQYSSCKD